MAEDIFREVDEELRRDRAAVLWKRYGNLVLAVAAAIVIAVTAAVVWREWQARRAAEDGAILSMAMQQIAAGETQAALAGLEELGASGTAGYPTVSRLIAAGVMAREGDRAQAAEIYRGVADEADDPYRSLATLLWALNATEADDAMIERLQPLTEQDSPWRFTAREISAVVHLRAGRRDDAIAALEAVSSDLSAPASARERATEALAGLEARD